MIRLIILTLLLNMSSALAAEDDSVVWDSQQHAWICAQAGPDGKCVHNSGSANFHFNGVICINSTPFTTTMELRDGANTAFVAVTPGSGHNELLAEFAFKERPRFVTKKGVRCYLIIDPKDLKP